MDWINVKDKLPRYNQDVIVFISTWRLYWCDLKNIAVGCRLSTNSNGEQWYIKGYNEGKSKVTHWMPLPEPPKE
jgi:hypothetical protein